MRRIVLLVLLVACSDPPTDPTVDAGIGVDADQGACQFWEQLTALSDRMAAEQALQGTLGQGRGADLSLAGQNAAFQQQTNLQQGQMNQGVNLANLQSQLAQTGMDDARQLAMLSQLFGVSEAEMRARLGQEASFNQNRSQGLVNTLGPALIGLAGGGGAGQQQRSG